MKKALSLILALVLCLVLCACGGEGGSLAPTEKNPIEIELNETVKAGNFEFTLTNVNFVEQHRYNKGSYEALSDGNVHFVVDAKFKNIGKEEIHIPQQFLSLEYGDGYTFAPEKCYHYSFETESYVANSEELPVLSQDKPCQAYFEVPEVVETSNESLELIITISGEQFVYIVRMGN